MNIVECKDVTKVYEQGRVRVTALAEVNLDIERGAFMAIAGPSGSGKTTLLNIIGGIDRPTSGEVWVDGENLAAMNDRQLTEYRSKRSASYFSSTTWFPPSRPWKTYRSPPKSLPNPWTRPRP